MQGGGCGLGQVGNTSRRRWAFTTTCTMGVISMECEREKDIHAEKLGGGGTEVEVNVDVGL